MVVGGRVSDVVEIRKKAEVRRVWHVKRARGFP